MAAMTVASTGLSMYGNAKAAKGQQAQYAHASAIAEQNAKAADVAALDAIERGEEEAEGAGREIAALRGRQTNAWASAGVELGYGTPVDVAQDLDVLSAEDMARIRTNAGREAMGYSIQASNYRGEAQGARMGAKTARSSYLTNQASTLVNGASQFAGISAKYGNPFKVG